MSERVQRLPRTGKLHLSFRGQFGIGEMYCNQTFSFVVAKRHPFFNPLPEPWPLNCSSLEHKLPHMKTHSVNGLEHFKLNLIEP